MLIISNVLWFPNLVHFNCLKNIINVSHTVSGCTYCECACECMQECVCECVCIDILKSWVVVMWKLCMVCVCVWRCSPSRSLGRQCVPCHSASKHTQLPWEKAGPLSLSISSPSPSIPPSSPYPPSPSLSFSFWQGRCLPLAVSLSIFTVHFTPTRRWLAAVGRESRVALAKCSCPLRTWMIRCTTSCTLSEREREESGGRR